MAASRSLTVLLVGHACSPGRGSEPGLTWNWAWHLSARHRVVVLAHPEYRAHVEQFLARHPNPNLTFVWVVPPGRLDPWDPARGERGIRLHYLLWLRAVLRVAARLSRERRFDVAHHVGWNTVSAPSPLWRLPVPLVWGPIGGGHATPAAFRRYFAGEWRREALRTLRLRLLPSLPPLRRAARLCGLLLATNRETRMLLEAAGARRVEMFLDTGVPPDYLPQRPPRRPVRRALTLVWGGRLEPIKALPLALEALAQARDVPARLRVAGDGRLRSTWERLAADLGVRDRVDFLGQVPWERMPDLFREGDAFVFTSLRDSSGSVVLEAMAHAMPILTLDHQGVSYFVPPEAGIKTPVTTPAETVAALAAGIRRLAASPEARAAMGEAAFRYARTQTWDRRAERMSHWYEACVGAARR